MYALQNPILEIDLAKGNVDWNKFTVEDMCQLILKWFDWIYNNLSEDAKIFVNIRDFPFAMIEAPARVLTVVKFLSCLSSEKRPLGSMYEEPTGSYLPEEVIS